MEGKKGSGGGGGPARKKARREDKDGKQVSVGKRPPKDLKVLKVGTGPHRITRVAKWGDKTAFFLCNPDDPWQNGFYKPPDAYKGTNFHVGDKITVLTIGYSASRNKVAQDIDIDTSEAICKERCKESFGPDGGCCTQSLSLLPKKKTTTMKPNASNETTNNSASVPVSSAPPMMFPPLLGQNFGGLKLPNFATAANTNPPNVPSAAPMDDTAKAASLLKWQHDTLLKQMLFAGHAQALLAQASKQTTKPVPSASVPGTQLSTTTATVPPPPTMHPGASIEELLKLMPPVPPVPPMGMTDPASMQNMLNAFTSFPPKTGFPNASLPNGSSK